MRTLTLASGKGGVGKTSCAVHLAAGFAREGRRALLVDLDSQGNATSWLLGTPPARGTAAVLDGTAGIGEVAVPVPGREGLEVVAGTAALAGADVRLAAEPGAEMVLRQALEAVAGRYDVAVLDCPPTLATSVIGAICAADGVLAPVAASTLGLAGLQRLEDVVGVVRSRLRVSVEVLGYVLFAADGREGVTAAARELLRAGAPGRLLEAEVRVSAAAKLLPGRQATAWDPGADPRGLADYRALLAEVGQRLGVPNSEAPRRAGGATP